MNKIKIGILEYCSVIKIILFRNNVKKLKSLREINYLREYYNKYPNLIVMRPYNNYQRSDDPIFWIVNFLISQNVVFQSQYLL